MFFSTFLKLLGTFGILIPPSVGLLLEMERQESAPNRTLTEVLTTGVHFTDADVDADVDADDNALTGKILQVIDETSLSVGDSSSDDFLSEGLMVDETTEGHESNPDPCSDTTSSNLFENGTDFASNNSSSRMLTMTCRNSTRLNSSSDISLNDISLDDALFNDTSTNVSQPLDVGTMSNTTAVEGALNVEAWTLEK